MLITPLGALLWIIIFVGSVLIVATYLQKRQSNKQFEEIWKLINKGDLGSAKKIMKKL